MSTIEEFQKGMEELIFNLERIDLDLMLYGMGVSYEGQWVDVTKVRRTSVNGEEVFITEDGNSFKIKDCKVIT